MAKKTLPKKKKPPLTQPTYDNESSLACLSGQQQKFVYEYLVDLKAGAAAARAGYSAGSASALMSNPTVRNAIGQALCDILLDNKRNAQAVVDQLHQALFLDPIYLFKLGESGSLTVQDLDLIPEPLRRCIISIDVEEAFTTDEDGTQSGARKVKIKFFSKEKAAELLAKYYALLGGDGDKVIEGQTAQKQEVGNLLGQALLKTSKRDNVLDVTPTHTVDDYVDTDDTA